jgi:hypothetical protein
LKKYTDFDDQISTEGKKSNSNGKEKKTETKTKKAVSSTTQTVMSAGSTKEDDVIKNRLDATSENLANIEINLEDRKKFLTEYQGDLEKLQQIKDANKDDLEVGPWMKFLFSL